YSVSDGKDGHDGESGKSSYTHVMYSDERSLFPMVPDLWEQGFWNASGNKASANYAVRIKESVSILSGEEYILETFGNNGVVIRIRNQSSSVIKTERVDKEGSYSFTSPQNASDMLFYITTYETGRDNITPAMIGNELYSTFI